MLIDGEKWACEACVRGHRVSNCQHADRPLQHINKKGRPVSQCQHCRSMRKSRSSHVKCDCGEKSYKCPHLQGATEGHKESCCCNHGGRCTCSHKREHPFLDPVPESDESDQEQVLTMATSKDSLRGRRRAATVGHADGILTFDENGHHKPTYKHAKAHETCGPYQLTRVHSMHGSSGLTNRSVDNLLHLAGLEDDGNTSSPASSMGAAHDQRQARSETGSPLMTGTSTVSQLNLVVPPLDLDFPAQVASQFDFFGNMSDNEQPLFSAGLSTSSVDWSNYEGLEFAGKAAESFAPSSYGQTQSLSGFDGLGSEQLPTLTTTTSNSGDLSESEDPLPATADGLNFEGALPISSASTNFGLVQSQAGLLASTDVANIDWEMFKVVKAASNKYLPTPVSMAADEPPLIPLRNATSAPTFPLQEEEPAFWMPDSLPSIWEMQ